MPQQVFRREGEYWTILYAGETCRLKDTNGLHFLHCLLRHPHEPIAALEINQATPRGNRRGGPATNGHEADHTTRERARVNVTRAIIATLKRIREHHPELARHLKATVRTGTFCVYTPDPRVPVGWEP
jgi:hypothetical protein